MHTASIDPVTIFQAVSDATRLRLLRLLRREELNVREMVSILDMNQPRVSKHLAVLLGGGWLRQRKEGTWSWYRAAAAREFPGGAELFDSVTAAADRVGSAARDDKALTAVLDRRDAKARDFFASVAEQWDHIRREYEDPDISIGAVSALVDPHQSVIDIGTGTGALLPHLGRAVKDVLAVDNSPAMLARARELCQREGLTRVRFQLADIQVLPLADDTFDAAYCSMALHHVARPERAIREMARVVKPGGKVVVIAFTKHNLTWLRTELAHHWLGFDHEELSQLFQAAGLSELHYRVRRRAAPAVGRDVLPPRRRGEQWVWPDVFLAVAHKHENN